MTPNDQKSFSTMLYHPVLPTGCQGGGKGGGDVFKHLEGSSGKVPGIFCFLEYPKALLHSEFWLKIICLLEIIIGHFMKDYKFTKLYIKTLWVKSTLYTSGFYSY